MIFYYYGEHIFGYIFLFALPFIPPSPSLGGEDQGEGA
jgi:hypothetical protein